MAIRINLYDTKINNGQLRYQITDANNESYMFVFIC